jgi:flagellar FliJ protein
MKSIEMRIGLETLLVDERRRKVDQIESMIADFERAAGELEREIKTEQDRVGIHDPEHFAYPTYARAARQRRENIERSVHQLNLKLEEAKAALGAAVESNAVESNAVEKIADEGRAA